MKGPVAMDPFGSRCSAGARRIAGLNVACDRGVAMMDLLFVGLTILFFLLSWWYVRACERV